MFTNTIIFFITLTLYSFIISINIQYDNFEFKRLLIDLITATQSIGGLGQLKTLQRAFFVELDKTIARLSNFIFGIDNIFSISIFNFIISL